MDEAFQIGLRPSGSTRAVERVFLAILERDLARLSCCFAIGTRSAFSRVSRADMAEAIDHALLEPDMLAATRSRAPSLVTHRNRPHQIRKRDRSLWREQILRRQCQTMRRLAREA